MAETRQQRLSEPESETPDSAQGEQRGEGERGSPQRDKPAHADEQAQGEREARRRRDDEEESKRRGSDVIGWLLTSAVVLLMLAFAALAIFRAVVNPRTDDAEVFANYIGMAPQVDGPITHVAIRDNQHVRAGDLLFEIDDRPYRYALERAVSDRAALEGQIEDRWRTIHSQQSAVRVAAANVAGATSNTAATLYTVSESQAGVANARASLARAESDRHYAEDNLHRLEPLLAQQFVTVDEVDRARTELEARSRAVDQARASVALQQARVNSQASRVEQAKADITQRIAQREQAANAVETIAPLTNQREARSSAIETAQYNLNNCRVFAPFDALVTNLTLSEGAFARTGQQVFTLIDNRTWWVVANFRETQLKHVHIGSPVDVFLLQQEDVPLQGTVESVGFGVTPDPSVAGIVGPGLPAVQRSLSWVHLAARYPVRIRIDHPPPGLLRIGQTAVAVVHDTPGQPPPAPPAPVSTTSAARQ